MMLADMQMQFTVLWALLRRDQKELWHDLRSSLINSAILVLCEGFQFLFLYPALGMSDELAASIFLGTYVIVLIMVGFARALLLAYDLKFNRVIDYTVMLPVKLPVLLARYIVNTVITMMCNVIPLLLIAKCMLGSQLDLAVIQWPAFVLLFVLSMFFVAQLFYLTVFLTSFDWFMDSLWQQFILPLEIFGGVFFTWAAVQTHFPFLSSVMLLNPMTYVIEGLRATVFPATSHFSPLTCAVVLSVAVIILFYILVQSARRRLDTL